MSNTILDITDIHCPMTFVKVKIALSQLHSGDELQVFLREGEPLENVPKAVERNGHTVLELKKEKNKIYRLLIKKK